MVQLGQLCLHALAVTAVLQKISEWLRCGGRRCLPWVEPDEQYDELDGLQHPDARVPVMTSDSRD